MGYDIVDTFTKFDAILISRSKVIIRPVLPLARDLIDTIMAQLWIFSKHVICAFCNDINHLILKTVEKCFSLVNFA